MAELGAVLSAPVRTAQPATVSAARKAVQQQEACPPGRLRGRRSNRWRTVDNRSLDRQGITLMTRSSASAAPPLKVAAL